MPTMTSKSVRTVAAAATAALALLAPAVALPRAAYAAAPSCRDADVSPTVEESRLTVTLGLNPQPVPGQILQRSGFDVIADQFEHSLCATRSAAAASVLVDGVGLRLWKAAVDRSRHATSGSLDLPRDDDRPLYWARLRMALALRQWMPSFPLGAADRAELQRRLEYASRGITSTSFGGRAGVRRLLVSGFDPFLLDTEIRRSNPSGAAVLRLDGTVLHLDGQRVEVQAVVFPVRYADFDQGIAEATFRAQLLPGSQRVDMFTTISQGRPGQFDLEVWNGRRRSVLSIGDNNNVWGGGTALAPVAFPGVAPGPEFVRSTLPIDAMLAADGQPFPVKRNTLVVEIPAGSTTPVVRPDGPTEGSIAVQGGGGGYLSNEVAYRATLLRNILAPDLPGGHLHTPVLDMAPDNLTEITDPTFEKNRTDIGTQVALALRLALG